MTFTPFQRNQNIKLALVAIVMIPTLNFYYILSSYLFTFAFNMVKNNFVPCNDHSTVITYLLSFNYTKLPTKENNSIGT